MSGPWLREPRKFRCAHCSRVRTTRHNRKLHCNTACKLVRIYAERKAGVRKYGRNGR